MISWAHSQCGAPQFIRRPFIISLQCQLSTLYVVTESARWRLLLTFNGSLRDNRKWSENTIDYCAFNHLTLVECKVFKFQLHQTMSGGHKVEKFQLHFPILLLARPMKSTDNVNHLWHFFMN